MQSAIPADLPIHDALPALLSALIGAPNAVLVAPPGAGKTTSVPLALLDAPWLEGRKIIMLAPRRLAARAAAARMASLLGEAVGQTIGYRVRLDSKTSNKTRVEVVTEGVFNRLILADPELSGIGGVIFDEVHERNLEGDLALALALDVQAGLRADLMGQAGVIESAGRMFRVDTHYVDANPALSPEIQAADIAMRALNEGPGDVLVFLPGVREINRALAHLEGKRLAHLHLVLLHGELDPRAQDEALAPPPNGKRKVILSTAIAQTSLTIEGVQIVVDTGQSRRAAYEPDTGLTRLVTVRASRASVDQRRGRAGRTAPGHCYRLWTQAQTGALPAFDRPEILEADLASLALTLAVWGVHDPTSLRWLDPPPKPAWQEATSLLVQLDALDAAGRITAHGRQLSDFGLPPRLANMIVTASGLGFGYTAACVASLLSDKGLGGNSVDLAMRLQVFARDQGQRAQKARGQAQMWARQMGANDPLDPLLGGKALALAYPERVAKARDRRGGFVLRNGRGGEVALDEPLASQMFLAVGAVQGRAVNARITEAAALSRQDLDDLFGQDITKAVSATYDPVSATMRGRSQSRLGALVLEETTLKLSPDAIAEGFYKAIKAGGLACWMDPRCPTVARAAGLGACP